MNDRSRTPPAQPPQWKQDFPIEWEQDHYLTRRELAKFLTLGSGLLLCANALMFLAGRRRRPEPAPPHRIGTLADVPPGGSLLFRYPTPEDPCILVRSRNGALQAYSQVCTHLACAVVHAPQSDELFCPCHRGYFSIADGRPTAGPATRRLPRVELELRAGDIFAVGITV